MQTQRPKQLNANDSVRIEKLVHGGWGLGRLAGGKVALVAEALPGEEVRIRLLREAGGHVEATIDTLLVASPERVEPPCPYYADCGGCNLQHTEYATQLRMKAAIVAENLQRAGLVLSQDCLAPTLPSPQQFGYRHRLRLHLQEGGLLGFYRRRSRSVVPVTRCLLATDGINSTLSHLAQKIDLALLAHIATALTLSQCPASGRIFLMLHTKKQAGTNILQTVTRMLAPQADFVLTHKGQGVHPQAVGEDVEHTAAYLCQHFSHSRLNYELRYSPGSFFQVNCQQNARLVALAMEAAATPARALDLFCGAGNFTIPLALLGAHVLGVEYSKESCAWAQMNSQLAGLSQIRFRSTDAVTELNRLVRRQERFDIILLDPPRQGLGKAAALLPQLAPQRIVSISCDPATHARDLRLMLTGGYTLNNILPLDMFPQTHHIEMLAILDKTKRS
ncbi:MAG: 23S rRNA (uracil(1939)-C(5))-methyltransferase RlmD [Desulfobulbus sp.]|jgi:23S rRNA (uracil1939-C5)-methyltransferase